MYEPKTDWTLPVVCCACSNHFVTIVPMRAKYVRCPACNSKKTEVEKPVKILASHFAGHYNPRGKLESPMVETFPAINIFDVVDEEVVEEVG